MSAVVVSSIAEWIEYASEQDEPVAHAEGALAEQIRERFGAADDALVVLREEYGQSTGCECCGWDVDHDYVIECGPYVQWFDVGNFTEDVYLHWLDAPRRRAEAEAQRAQREAERREHSVAFDAAVTTPILDAMKAVEVEGYSSDQDWHDKIMCRLGVKGYAS